MANQSMDCGESKGYPPEVTNFLIESDYTYEKFVVVADKFARLTKDELTAAFTEIPPKKNGKDILKIIREELGKFLTKKFFNVHLEFTIKRSSIKTLADEVYLLVHSLQNGQLCAETLLLFSYESTPSIPLASLPEAGIGEIMRTIKELSSTVDKLKTEVKCLKLHINASSGNTFQSTAVHTLNSSANNRKRSLSSAGSDAPFQGFVTPSRKTRRDSISNSMAPPPPPCHFTTSLSQGQTPLPATNSINSNDIGMWNKRLTHSEKQKSRIVATQKKLTTKPSSQHKKHKQRETVVGSGMSDNLLGVPKKRFYKISKVAHGTNISAIKEHITSFLKCDSSEVVVDIIERAYTSYFSLFKVTVDAKYSVEMESPGNWPDNVEVSRFFHNRNKNDKKNDTTAARAGSTENRS